MPKYFGRVVSGAECIVSSFGRADVLGSIQQRLMYQIGKASLTSAFIKRTKAKIMTIRAISSMRTLPVANLVAAVLARRDKILNQILTKSTTCVSDASQRSKQPAHKNDAGQIIMGYAERALPPSSLAFKCPDLRAIGTRWNLNYIRSEGGGR